MSDPSQRFRSRLRKSVSSMFTRDSGPVNSNSLRRAASAPDLVRQTTAAADASNTNPAPATAGATPQLTNTMSTLSQVTAATPSQTVPASTLPTTATGSQQTLRTPQRPQLGPVVSSGQAQTSAPIATQPTQAGRTEADTSVNTTSERAYVDNISGEQASRSTSRLLGSRQEAVRALGSTHRLSNFFSRLTLRDRAENARGNSGNRARNLRRNAITPGDAARDFPNRGTATATQQRLAPAETLQQRRENIQALNLPVELESTGPSPGTTSRADRVRRNLLNEDALYMAPYVPERTRRTRANQPQTASAAASDQTGAESHIQSGPRATGEDSSNQDQLGALAGLTNDWIAQNDDQNGSQNLLTTRRHHLEETNTVLNPNLGVQTMRGRDATQQDVSTVQQASSAPALQNAPAPTSSNASRAAISASFTDAGGMTRSPTTAGQTPSSGAAQSPLTNTQHTSYDALPSMRSSGPQANEDPDAITPAPPPEPEKSEQANADGLNSEQPSAPPNYDEAVEPSVGFIAPASLQQTNQSSSLTTAGPVWPRFVAPVPTAPRSRLNESENQSPSRFSRLLRRIRTRNRGSRHQDADDQGGNQDSIEITLNSGEQGRASSGPSQTSNNRAQTLVHQAPQSMAQASRARVVQLGREEFEDPFAQESSQWAVTDVTGLDRDSLTDNENQGLVAHRPASSGPARDSSSFNSNTRPTDPTDTHPRGSGLLGRWIPSRRGSPMEPGQNRRSQTQWLATSPDFGPLATGRVPPNSLATTPTSDHLTTTHEPPGLTELPSQNIPQRTAEEIARRQLASALDASLAVGQGSSTSGAASSDQEAGGQENNPSGDTQGEVISGDPNKQRRYDNPDDDPDLVGRDDRYSGNGGSFARAA